VAAFEPAVRRLHAAERGSRAMVVRSTILDGLRTAAQVACQFEFDSLRRQSQRNALSPDKWCDAVCTAFI
jgi:hypothetical protein